MEQLDDEIKHVASLIKDAAETILPFHKAKRANRFKDRTLSQLCKVKSRGRHGRMEPDPVKDLSMRLNVPLVRK